MFKNMNKIDRVTRLLIGTSLLALVLFNSTWTPLWFALVAPYFILTAMTSLDPIYALGKKLIFGNSSKMSTVSMVS